MSELMHEVVIVGGGITGLSTAWYLQQAGVTNVAVLERDSSWGGKIQTEEMGVASAETPFILEAGPDSFLTSKPWAWQLARELGLDDQFLPTNDQNRHIFVLNHGKPTSLPDGVMLIVPTKFTPFVTSSLISWPGKLRMGMDLFIKRKDDGADETLAAFVARRLGNEALDKIAEPLMSGIYNADAEMQSVLATFPRFREIEQKYGSLIKGMLAAKAAPRPANAGASGAAKSPSMFVSFRQGMRTLVEGLVPRLTADLRLSTAVVGMSPTAGGYTLRLSDGSVISAERVVLAVPAFVAAKLLDEMVPEAAETLRQIRYVSTGTVSLGYQRADVAHPLNGFGIVIPRSERRRINAITWSSTKFDQRAPHDHALIRVFFGGSRTPEMMDLADEDLMAIVREELADIMGLDAEPLFEKIFRWHNATPQYDVGHLERVSAVENALPAGLFVTGSPYRGIGVPDCVKQAQATAELITRTEVGQAAEVAELVG